MGGRGYFFVHFTVRLPAFAAPIQKEEGGVSTLWEEGDISLAPRGGGGGE